MSYLIGHTETTNIILLVALTVHSQGYERYKLPRMYCIPMAAKIVQHSAVVIALLVLSTSGAVAQDEYDRKMLLDLFETALLNNSDALWILQNIFFNPGSKQSPETVCLSVSILVQDIAHPESEYCDYNPDPEMGPAFVYDNGI